MKGGVFMIAASPHINDLLSFIKKVPHYPISAPEVTRIAKDKGADKDVIEFYGSFPDRAVFSDKEDLVVRTESLEILSRDDQPQEFFNAPEED